LGGLAARSSALTARPKAALQRGNSAANAEKLGIRFIEFVELTGGVRF
jgi:hypothetical protein